MYNIYYGTIGKTLGVKYRSTKNFKNEKEALKFTKKLVDSFYFVNEGKFGLPSFKEISKESKITANNPNKKPEFVNARNKGIYLKNKNISNFNIF